MFWFIVYPVYMKSHCLLYIISFLSYLQLTYFILSFFYPDHFRSLFLGLLLFLTKSETNFRFSFSRIKFKSFFFRRSENWYPNYSSIHLQIAANIQPIRRLYSLCHDIQRHEIMKYWLTHFTPLFTLSQPFYFSFCHFPYLYMLNYPESLNDFF